MSEGARIDRKHFFLTMEPGIGWFRLFGRGIGWKDTRRHRLLFSERNGLTPHVMIGPWSIAWLRVHRGADAARLRAS